MCTVHTVYRKYIQYVHIETRRYVSFIQMYVRLLLEREKDGKKNRAVIVALSLTKRKKKNGKNERNISRGKKNGRMKREKERNSPTGSCLLKLDRFA